MHHNNFLPLFTSIKDCSDVLFDFPSRNSPFGPALEGGGEICLMEANSFRWQLASDKKGAQK